MSRSLVLVVALALIGCSNHVAQKTQKKAVAEAPATPGSSKLVVIPNPYDDDRNLAERATEETKAELTKRGYNLVSTETEADLVVVPTVETGVTVSAPGKTANVFDAGSGAQFDQSANVGSGFGSFNPLVTAGFAQAGNVSHRTESLLVIEAFNRDAWDKALIVNELQLPPVWKVKVPLPKSLMLPMEGTTAPEGTTAARTKGTEFVLPH